MRVSVALFFASLLLTASVGLAQTTQPSPPPFPCAASPDPALDAPPPPQDDYWVEHMMTVHAGFNGPPGMVAVFGDTNTYRKGFWCSFRNMKLNVDRATQAAINNVCSYMRDECWDSFRGDKFGNKKNARIGWAEQNASKWLKKVKPETAIILFGTADLGKTKPADFERRTRHLVQTCLDNGTIVILTTIPPNHKHQAEAADFAEIQRKIAHDMCVPLVDLQAQILARRPDDWDGSLDKFVAKKPWDVSTLVGRDGWLSNTEDFQGDYSQKGLDTNGLVLRNYLTLHKYNEVIDKVLKPAMATATTTAPAPVPQSCTAP